MITFNKRITCALAALAAASSACASGYVVTPLQVPANAVAEFVRPKALNDAGLVIGEISVKTGQKTRYEWTGSGFVRRTVSQFARQAVSWRDGRITVLKALPLFYADEVPGVEGCFALGLNEQSVIVGACMSSEPFNGVKVRKERAVAWSGQQALDLRVPDAGLGSQAVSVAEQNTGWINRPVSRYALPNFWFWQNGALTEAMPWVKSQMPGVSVPSCSPMDQSARLFCLGSPDQGGALVAKRLDWAGNASASVSLPPGIGAWGGSLMSSRQGVISTQFVLASGGYQQFVLDNQGWSSRPMPGGWNLGTDQALAVGDAGELVVRRAESESVTLWVLTKDQAVSLTDAVRGLLDPSEQLRSVLAINAKGQLLCEVARSLTDTTGVRYVLLTPR